MGLKQLSFRFAPARDIEPVERRSMPELAATAGMTGQSLILMLNLL